MADLPRLHIPKTPGNAQDPRQIPSTLRTSDLTLDEAVRARLRGVDLGIGARVLEALVPAEVNLKVVLVGQGVGDGLGLGGDLEDLLAHLVHGVLDAGALVLGKGLEGDGAGGVPGGVEAADVLLDGGEAVGEGPGPGGVDVGGEDAVPGLGQGGVRVADEAVEGRAGGLEDGELLDAARQGDAVAGDAGLDGARLLAVAQEGVRVRLAVDVEARPAVDGDANVGDRDVGVRVEEVGAEDGGVELGRVDGVLLGLDVNGVLDRVGGHDDRVVGDGVRRLNGTLEESADGHLGDGLHGAVLLDLEDADIVLAVAGRSEDRHDE
ncbi:hypothetical protein BN1708_005120 [Verticillium longisporum]|uniref:Uncharacterized protein n=1 Tax=Verticillium longisporum TaxID=100787 RepID=A0A0G4M711_VERLO|nr:hypothetical protein BN1708_005120 [Verticillium longisporum]